MASNRIRGITIEIDGNTTKLTDSLKNVDKSLKDTQAQMKEVDRLLKLDPGNIELLRQKNELLAKAIKDTKNRQDELKTALEQAKNAGDTEENRKQQDLLQRELIETTQKLEGLEEQYKKSSPVLESIATKTGQLSEKTKKLSATAGVAGVAMIGMATKAAANADDLLTMSRNTGFSVEELQKLQYASDLVDVSYDTMTGSIQKLTKQMGTGNEAFDTLGVAITNEDGTMRSAVDVWYDAIAALGEVENGTKRDQLSMELFGKSAMEMSGIVDDGGEALKSLGEEAEATGNILGQDEVENAGKFNDAIDKLKGTAMQAFLSAGATLAETLVPALEKLVEVVSNVLNWFGNLDGTTQVVILTILGLVAAISPVLGLVSTLTTLAAALNVSMLPMIATIAAIVVAIGALVAAGVWLYQNWDTVKEKASSLWQSLKDTFERIKTAITTPIEAAKDKVKEIIDKIKGFFSGMKISFPSIPLPHFSVKPKGWKVGDLLKGSIPKLSIDWYARAMNSGMILDRPTIFGEQNGRLLAGGEAGREVVVGANSLMTMIQKATARANNEITVNVTVNGNVDDYDALADTIGQKLQQQMARQERAFA